ncbi:MAG: hypothetical protein ACRD2R_00785 [Terriglobales bacterium]
MSSIVRKLVVANLAVAAVLFLGKPLRELSSLPDESLANVLRHVAQLLATGVALVGPVARIWLLASSALLLLRAVLEALGRFSPRSANQKHPAAKRREGFLLDVLLVAVWLAVYGLGFSYRGF